MKIGVASLLPYSIIFYNMADEAQRSELFIDAAEKLFVTADVNAYLTQAEAAVAIGVTQAIDPNNRNYGPDVEVITEMIGEEVKAADGINWVLPVTCVSVVGLGAAAA